MNPSSGFVQIFVITALIAIAGVLTLVLALSGTGLRSGVALDRTVISDAIAGNAFMQRAEAFATGQGNLEPSETVVSGERTSTVIENDGGKISVLSAPPEVIEAYASRAGLAVAARQALLTDLQALRTRNDGTGALAALELAFGPSLPHAQFQRDFSAYAQFATIDPAVASETVLAALPDLTDMERADILAVRARGEAPPFGLSAYLGNPQPYYSLVVTVHWSGSEQSTLRIPFELTNAGLLRQIAAPGP